MQTSFPMQHEPDVALSDPSGVAVLGSLMAAITCAGDLTAIYEAAFDAFADGLGVRRASVLLFDDDRVMRFKAWRGLSDGYRRAVEGHTPWTPETRDAAIIVVPDVGADADLAPHLPAIAAEGIAGVVFVPLRSIGGVIGKFTLYFAEPRSLSEPELTMADVIAAQVAFAVHRLRAEQAARERETQLRLVTDVAPVYIAHCDAQRRYRFVNLPFAERFQLSPPDVIGRTIAEVLGEAAYESLRTHVDAVLAGRPVAFEIEVPYDTGPRIMRGEFAPEIGADGRVSGFIAVVADVTDRRRAEAVIRQKDALFRQLADALPQMVWMARPDGEVDYYNERWYDFTGFARDGDSWTPILYADDLDRTLERWQEAVQSGDPYAIEYRFIDLAVPDVADWCAVDLVEAGGELRRLALACWDRTKAEFAREMERRYPSRPEDPYGPRPVLGTGRSVLIPEVTDEMLVGCAYDEEHLGLLRAAGLKSAISVPLKAGARVVGAMTLLTSESRRRYGPADLAVAEELAYRAGIAIENARLYTDLQQADRQKDAAGTRAR